MTKSKVPVTHIEGANDAAADTTQQTQAKDSARPSSADAAAKTKSGASIFIDPTESAYDEAGSQATGAASPKGRASGPNAWVGKIAPGHEHAILGGLCGLVFAVLFFAIGFWKTLFVALLVFVGVAFGQYLDGDPKIINFIRRALTGGLDD